MLAILELERHWPQNTEPADLSLMENLIQQKETLLTQLEEQVAKSSVPQNNIKAWMATLPAIERESVAREWEMLREATILTLDWHHKNAGQLSLQAEEVAKVLQGVHQEMAVMHALRMSPPVTSRRMDVVG